MKVALSTVIEHRAWGFISTRAKCLWALGIAVCALQASAGAETLQSPRGAETFAVAPPPTAKKVQLSWQFPASLQTPDLIFKVYHSTNLGVPLRLWAVLTNVPGSSRTVDLLADKAVDFYTLTASNYLGESSYATK